MEVVDQHDRVIHYRRDPHTVFRVAFWLLVVTTLTLAVCVGLSVQDPHAVEEVRHVPHWVILALGVMMLACYVVVFRLMAVGYRFADHGRMARPIVYGGVGAEPLGEGRLGDAGGVYRDGEAMVLGLVRGEKRCAVEDFHFTDCNDHVVLDFAGDHVVLLPRAGVFGGRGWDRTRLAVATLRVIAAPWAVPSGLPCVVADPRLERDRFIVVAETARRRVEGVGMRNGLIWFGGIMLISGLIGNHVIPDWVGVLVPVYAFGGIIAVTIFTNWQIRDVKKDPLFRCRACGRNLLMKDSMKQVRDEGTCRGCGVALFGAPTAETAGTVASTTGSAKMSTTDSP